MVAESSNQQFPHLSPEQLLNSLLGNAARNVSGNKHRAHGLTGDQMDDLHARQRVGDHEMITANKDSRVKIKKCDAHLVHAVIENVEYHVKTGAKISVPLLQCYGVDDFERMQNSVGVNAEAAFKNLSVNVVHYPEKKGAAKAVETTKVAEIAETEGEGMQPTPEQQALPAAPQKINKGNIHTLNNKSLKALYAQMFPDGSPNTPPDPMRKQILAKLEAEANPED